MKEGTVEKCWERWDIARQIRPGRSWPGSRSENWRGFDRIALQFARLPSL